MTAETICRVRRNTDEATLCKSFLTWVTTERLVQLAMLADAGDESIALTRICDREGIPTEDLPYHIQNFLDRINMLFVDGAVVKSGYTAYMISLLRGPSLVLCVGNKLISVGGADSVTPALVQRCVLRLGCWTKMAQSVVEAEFPNFRIFTAFSLFSISEQVGGSSLTPGCHREHCERLAKFFKVDIDKFMAQYNQVYSMACKMKHTDNRDAWRQALEKMQNGRGTSPEAFLELGTVLVRWAAWTTSTSGVEQNFSQLQRVHTSQCEQLGEKQLLDVMTLVVDELTTKERDEIICHARSMWVEPYGRTRVTCVDTVRRIGSRKKMPQSVTTSITEKGFLNKRKQEVQEAVKKWKEAGLDTTVLDRSAKQCKRVWTPEMQAEVDFQDAKRQKRLIVSEIEGHTLSKDLPTGFENKKAEFLKRARENDNKHIANDKRRNAGLALLSGVSRPTVVKLRDAKVFLDARLDKDVNRDACKNAGMKQVLDKNKANMFVVPAFNNMGQRILWNCILRGCVVMDTNYIKSSGNSGTIVVFHAAVETRKQLWMSPRWCARHPTLVEIIETAVRSRVSTWTMLAGNMTDFAKATKTRGTVVGLVTPSDKAENEVIN
jgi:hypothetical protein